MNEPLKLDYILKIAAAYFNEIAMRDYAVDRDCSRSIKSPYYLSIATKVRCFSGPIYYYKHLLSQIISSAFEKGGCKYWLFTLKA